MWETAYGVGFVEQLAAAGLQGLVGLLVAGDLDAGGGVGEPHGGERHAESPRRNHRRSR